MEKFWLPPLEICCNSTKLEIVIAVNETIGIKSSCFTHGKSFIESPFSKSKKKIEIRFSKELKKMMGIKKPRLRASSNPASMLLA